MKYFTLLIFCLITHINLFAQSFSWASAMGTGNNSGITKPVFDDSGNIYCFGKFQGTADFDPSMGVFSMTSTGSGSGFIVKFSPSGAFTWARQVNPVTAGLCQPIAVTYTRGGLVVVGTFSGSVDFDPGTGSTTKTSVAFIDAFVARYTLNGELDWVDVIGGTGNQALLDVTSDLHKNIIVGGHFNGTVDTDPGTGVSSITSSGEDILLVKLDSAGNFIWSKRMGGTGEDWAYAICTDRLGNVYCTGQFFGTADMDPNSGVANLVTSPYYRDAYVDKLDSNGNYLWAGQLGDITNEDIGYNIAVDDSLNMYYTGMYSNNADLDPGPGTYYLPTGSVYADAFLSKLNAAGEMIWTRQIGSPTGSDFGRMIAFDGRGHVYLQGSFTGTADMDPGPGVYSLSSYSATQYDAFINKYDTGGNIIWAGSVGGAGSDVGYGISVDAHNSIFTTGMVSAAADMDPGTDSTIVSVGWGSYVLKLSQCIAYMPVITVTGTADTLWNVHTDTFSVTTDGATTPGSYQWYLNGLLVAGATSGTYVGSGLNNGDLISCVVTVADTCASSATAADTFSVTIIDEGGVANATSSSIWHLSPNPCNGTFTLSGDAKEAEELNYIISDITGKTVKCDVLRLTGGHYNEQITLPTTISTGIYILQLQSTSGTGKILLEVTR